MNEEMTPVVPIDPAATASQGSQAAVESHPVPTFAEVYEAHVRFVWRTLRRLGVPNADCDDAVQDVFLIVYRRLPDFRPDAPVKHWLYRITAHIARDHRRSGQRRNPREHGLAPIQGDDIEDPKLENPAQSAERSAAARIIRSLLQELEESRREVFILAELEQMTAPEIAQVLEVPLNTVYSRLRRARLDFQEALERRERSSQEAS
jgi:RNA polymerase sigma-70 factor (ECF subfamily)